jgi:hypothetical protein
VAFYEQVASSASACPRLTPFLPSYFGTHRFRAMDYLAMEDIAIRFREPCVLDLKLGVRTYEPDATAEKIASELRKCPAQAAVGFRPCGMRVYGSRSRQYRCRDKDWGRRITTETAPALLAEFVCDDEASLSVRRISRVLPPLLRRLRELEVAMREQLGLRFYASSIVVVYEGSDEGGRPGDEAGEGGAAAIDLRIVDFAHWVRAAQGRKGARPCLSLSRARSLRPVPSLRGAARAPAAALARCTRSAASARLTRGIRLTRGTRARAPASRAGARRGVCRRGREPDHGPARRDLTF